jgi:hypothetical protein
MPQEHRKRLNLTEKCLKQEVVPGLFQSSQATVLELWASPHLLGPQGTQLDASWNHPETPQEYRKRPNLTEKCLKQKVVPGLFQSSQATVLELWASLHLLGPPGTQLDTSWSHLETLQKHRKRPNLTENASSRKSS